MSGESSERKADLLYARYTYGYVKEELYAYMQNDLKLFKSTHSRLYERLSSKDARQKLKSEFDRSGRWFRYKNKRAYEMAIFSEIYDKLSEICGVTTYYNEGERLIECLIDCKKQIAQLQDKGFSVSWDLSPSLKSIHLVLVERKTWKEILQEYQKKILPLKNAKVNSSAVQTQGRRDEIIESYNSYYESYQSSFYSRPFYFLHWIFYIEWYASLSEWYKVAFSQSIYERLKHVLESEEVRESDFLGFIDFYHTQVKLLGDKCMRANWEYPEFLGMFQIVQNLGYDRRAAIETERPSFPSYDAEGKEIKLPRSKIKSEEFSEELRILGITKELKQIDYRDIVTAYKKKALRFHPDKRKFVIKREVAELKLDENYKKSILKKAISSYQTSEAILEAHFEELLHDKEKEADAQFSRLSEAYQKLLELFPKPESGDKGKPEEEASSFAFPVTGMSRKESFGSGLGDDFSSRSSSPQSSPLTSLLP